MYLPSSLPLGETTGASGCPLTYQITAYSKKVSLPTKVLAIETDWAKK